MVFSRICDRNTLIGRRVFTCLLFLLLSLHARSLTDEVQQFLLREQPVYGADSSAVSISSAYNLPVYYRSETPFGDTLQKIDFNHLTNRIDATLCYERWGSRISILHHHKIFDFVTITSSDSDGVKSISNQLHARGDIWVNMGDTGTQIGLSLGRYFLGDTISFPHKSTIYEHPFTSFSDNPKSSYALWWKIQWRSLTTGLILDKTVPLFEPMHLYKSSGSYKNLPMIQFQRRIRAEATLSKWGKSLSFWWSRTNITGEKIELSNCLPFMSEWLLYKVGGKADLGAHTLQVEAFTSKGALFGYEDTKPTAPRYLIFDDLFLKRLEGDYSFTFPRLAVLGVTGELFKGNASDYGTVELYPFSSWSLFKPVKYRFSDSFLAYRKVGVTSQLSLSRRHKTTLGFDLDFHKTEMKTIREERKIVVLVPVYINEKTVEPLHYYILTGDLQVSQKFFLKDLELDLSLSQLIPLYVKDYKEAKNSVDNEPSALDKKVFGGLKASIKLIVPF